jgi:uncharacterized protein DUF3455
MTRTRTTSTTCAFRWHRLTGTLAALALLPLAFMTPARADDYDDPAPDLGQCQPLQVPPGNVVAFHLHAVGVQIYRWNGTSWSFVAPAAVLLDAGDGGAAGVHYAGPTWQSLSGSKVVGTVLERCTPEATALPWLLLEAGSHEGAGLFDRVTYIQRLYTVGGNAPTVSGGVEGEVARVPYTAEYFFYKADN